MAVEWDPGPPTTKQRIVAGVLVAAMILTSANLYFGWGLFAGYDKPVTGACFIISLLILTGFMPGTRRV